MINFCKKRKFPDWHWFVYDLKKSEQGNWLNTWFEAEDWIDKYKKVHKRNEYWTVKKVDEESACHLYRRYYHPIFISIMLSYRKNRAEWPFTMKAQICSPDDSSYGIWFQDMPLDKLEQIRLEIMKWINSQSIINGEKFLTVCEELGGVDKDYN